MLDIAELTCESKQFRLHSASVAEQYYVVDTRQKFRIVAVWHCRPSKRLWGDEIHHCPHPTRSSRPIYVRKNE